MKKLTNNQIIGTGLIVVLLAMCSPDEQTQTTTASVDTSQHLVSEPDLTSSEQIDNTLPFDLHCKVIGIVDGDTISCLTEDKQKIKIRLDQIDAPEKKQDFGNASKKALSNYVHSKNVDVISNGTDKYGRTLGEVYINDENINKKLVENGYAWAYKEHLRDSEYSALESTARSQSLGLWSQPNPIYPSEFRHPERGTENTESVKPKPKTNDDGGFSCNGKRFCKEMNSCAEARFYLNQCGVGRLDRDNDGIPCESIC